MAVSRITLLSNASATGSYVTIPVPGEYVCMAVGTFGGATVQLQVLGPDGSTAISIPSASASGATSFVVALAGEMQVRASVSGGAPSGLYVSLDKATT